MKPKKLTLCGWGPYKSIEEVDFTAFEEKGVFLITGATGSGKTTIFDAISYALYGALSGDERDKERSSTRSDFAEGDTPTYVELLMEHKGQTYHIRRNPEYLRPKKRSSGQAVFTKEKENAILTYPDGRVLEGVREVNAAMKELLVLDYRQFKKISMIAQGEFARLLVAPPKEKTAIFREIFDTGVLERFTRELGERARAAYAKVAEQKHKLEEDVRLLLTGIEKSSWGESLKEELLAVTSAENWNYEALCDCLRKMEQEAGAQVAALKKAHGKAQEKVEALSSKLTSLEEENKQIMRFCQVKQDVETLQGQAEAFVKKQEVYRRAMNAGWAEGAEAKVVQAEKLLTQNERRRTVELATRMEEARQALHDGQQRYLAQEIRCKEQTEKCEEAERRRRMDAVGLAASLLEEGKPCPVCGSVEHPAPAGVSGEFGENGAGSRETISEEQIKQLKKALQAEEEKLTELHGKAVMLKTRLESLEEQNEQLLAEEAELKRQSESAREEFRQALQQYGFGDVAEYRNAKLSKEDREALQEQVETYQTKKAAAEELFAHLKQTISSTEPIDLTQMREETEQVRTQRDAVLKEWKLWERQRDEAHKTAKMVSDKLDVIAQVSGEYGYVKDLENLATGNNSRRLVFEQYVLAGYFEEILRAANLRFAKMTGGRYEMSRLQQVGDGRVKDNLEIEVLDYYTGKYRSVRTLSGGESFKASLSLALGMSDVIQAMNGGIRVDALFVDEGFGTLDEESLDQACSTLMSLAEKKHLIGIISHVPELRERIDNQLIVEKSGNGSRIKVRI